MPLAWINRSVDQCKNNILSYFFGSSCWFHKRGHSSAAPKSFDDWSKHQAWSNVCVCVMFMHRENENWDREPKPYWSRVLINPWQRNSAQFGLASHFINYQLIPLVPSHHFPTSNPKKMMCSFNHQLLQLPLEWVRYFLSFRRWATIANGWQRSVLVDKTGHQTKNQRMDNKNEVFAHSVTST